MTDEEESTESKRIRAGAQNLLKIYGIIWEEVNQTPGINELQPSVRKDIATSIFIQLERRGFK